LFDPIDVIFQAGLDANLRLKVEYCLRFGDIGIVPADIPRPGLYMMRLKVRIFT
jgi:hypothetical protein